MPLSIDLRKRVIASVDEGIRITDIAKTFKICRKTIYLWLNLREKNESFAPKSGYQRGHSHKITDWEKFKQFVDEHRYLPSHKMVVEWEKFTGVHMSVSVMKRALKKIGYSSKKNIWVCRS